MSSIMRARSGLTRRGEVSESSGSSPELKVDGPSMLGIGCPDRHALPLTPLYCRSKCTDRDARHPAMSGFVLRPVPVAHARLVVRQEMPRSGLRRAIKLGLARERIRYRYHK